MRAFEIHTFQSGKWKIDSVFDDRDLAVFEAQRMEGSKRYIGVRVVEETFDEATQHTATRTIYKGTMLDPVVPDPARKAAAGGKATKAAPGGAAQPAARRTAKAPAPARSSSSTGLLVTLLATIVVVGIGAVVALRMLSGQM